jgi:hypothetical protein
LKNSRILSGIILFVFFIFLFGITLSRYPNWGDSAKLINLVMKLKFASDSGHHNLLLIIYHYPAKIILYFWQYIDPALLINAINMVFSVLTLLLCYIFFLQTGNTLRTAIFLTSCLGLSHLFWHLTVITESYNLTLCFLVLFFIFWRSNKESPSIVKEIILILLAGFSIQINLISLPILVCFLLLNISTIISLLKSRVLLKLFLFLVVFSISLLPTILIFVKEIQEGSKFTYILFENFFQQKYRSSVNILFLVDIKKLLKVAAVFIYQFPFLILLYLGSLIFKVKKGEEKVIHSTYIFSLFKNIALFVCVIVFVLIYDMPKSFYFLVFSNLFFLFAISYRITGIVENISGKVFGFLLVCLFFVNISVYKLIPALIATKQIGRKVPFRNTAIYFLSPWKHNEKSSYNFIEFCKRALGENAVIISDFTVSALLLYYKEYGIYNEAPPFKTLTAKIWDIDDIDLLTKIRNVVGLANIYFVGGAPEYEILKQHFKVIKAGEVYKIIP